MIAFRVRTLGVDLEGAKMRKALITTVLAGCTFLAACGEVTRSEEEASAALAAADNETQMDATEKEIDECAAAYRVALQREYDGSGMSEEHLAVLARHACTKMTPEERTLGLPDRSNSGGRQSGEVAVKSTPTAIGPEMSGPVCQLGRLDPGSAGTEYGPPVPLAQQDELEAQIPALRRKNPESQFMVTCEDLE